MTHQQEHDFLSLVHTTRSGDQQLMKPEHQECFLHATRSGYIIKRPTTGAYELTEKGIQRYLALQDLLEKQKQDRKRHKKESRLAWLQWVLSGIFSLLCVFLGAYLTLSTHWFDWLQALIK